MGAPKVHIEVQLLPTDERSLLIYTKEDPRYKEAGTLPVGINIPLVYGHHHNATSKGPKDIKNNAASNKVC